MTAEELARLGQMMRQAQKDYFRCTADRMALDKAKNLERRFDKACKEVLDGPQPAQLGLFDPRKEDGR